MARIIPIQIPKTVSSPADPSAPSFLSTLPPEIRNPIYEVLFKRDGEVLLHDAKAYRQQIREYLTAMGYRYKDSMAFPCLWRELQLLSRLCRLHVIASHMPTNLS
jgi:hypothetical protein